MNRLYTEDVEYQHFADGDYHLANTNAFRYPDATPRYLLDDNDQLALIGKLKEKVQGSDFNLAIFLAEANESLHMIADTAYRLGGAITSVKKGNLRAAVRYLFQGTDRKPKQKHLGKEFAKVTRLRSFQLA
jgi:hypothetical protein